MRSIDLKDIEKALRLQNILSGMSVNEGQSDQTR